jgi:hypothetical protein
MAALRRFDLMLAVKDHPFEKRAQFVSGHSTAKAAIDRMRSLAWYTGHQMGWKGFALYVTERGEDTGVVSGFSIDQVWVTSLGMRYLGGCSAQYRLDSTTAYAMVQNDGPLPTEVL